MGLKSEKRIRGFKGSSDSKRFDSNGVNNGVYSALTPRSFQKFVFKFYSLETLAP